MTVSPEDNSDDTSCRNDDCDDDTSDGEGYDGFCGNCADRAEHALEELGLDESFFEELAESGYDAGDMGPGRARNGETVAAWATRDGWMARVRFPSPGYGPDALDVDQLRRLRRRARRAIRRGIELAGSGDRDRTLRLRVHTIDGDPHRVVRSLTFCETTD